MSFRAQALSAAAEPLTKIAFRGSIGFDEIRDDLSKRVDHLFDSFIREILKEDATGRGPAGGKGWPALTMLFWGRLFSDVRDIRQKLEQEKAESGLALRDAEQRLGAKLDEILRWQGQVGVGHDSLLREWIESLDQRFRSRLYQISELVGHGLDSPETFCLNYWNKRRILFPALWADSIRAQILTEELVGRSDELNSLHDFLAKRKRVGSLPKSDARGWKIAASH